MASIHAYRTSKGERRYNVHFRDQQGRQRARAFSTHKDAIAFKVDVERRRQAGGLYQAQPERFSALAQSWLERYEAGTASRVRPRPRSIALARENLRHLAPLSELSVDRITQRLVEELIVTTAARTPRRAEMTLALLKRILRDGKERGQPVDPSVFRVRIARTEEREPRFLTWEEADELQSWMPEKRTFSGLRKILVLHQCCMEDNPRGTSDREIPAKSLWAVQGSNLRPPACKAVLNVATAFGYPPTWLIRTTSADLICDPFRLLLSIAFPDEAPPLPHRAAGRDALRYAYRMAQVVARLEDRLVAEIDALVADGVVASRSEAVRLGLEKLVDRHHREQIAAQIVDAYQRLPQTDEELAGLDEATRALVDEDSW